MASQISPGILLRERDVTTATIVGAQALTAAFASTFTKGPVDRITEIDSQRALLDTFGLPTEANAEDWFVASEFLNYGGRLAVVRALTDGVKTANVGGSDLVVKNELDWLGNNYANEFAARSPGKWGNSAQVVVVDSGADVYVELESAPADTSVAVGSTWEFSNGATGYVLSWDAAENKAALVIVDGDEPSVGDYLNDGDEIAIAGFTTNAATEAGRTPGTYTVGGDGDTRGATFDVVVADASVGEVASGSAAGSTDLARADGVYTFTNPASSGSGTGAVVEVTIASGVASATVTGGTGYVVGETFTISGTDLDDLSASFGGTTDVVVTVNTLDVVGGAVTVTLNAKGDGYSVGDTLTLLGASTGGGSNITVTVTVLEDDVEVTSVYDWYTNTTIPLGTSGLTIPLNSLGVRPGTSQYARERGIVGDEISVAVVDLDGRLSGTVGNVVERITSLSKLTDGRSAENGAVYYRDIINDQSSYVFAGSNPLETVLTAASTGDSRFIAWSQDSVDIVDSGSDRTFAVAGAVAYTLTAGADDYNYTAGEITAAYDNFASSDETELDFLLMGGSMSSENDTKIKASHIVAIADNRKDCIAFVSPHKGNQIGTGGVSLSSTDQKTRTINFFRSITSTSFAVFDSGYKYLYDRFNDRYRYVPCNGDIAGLCVSTSQQLGDWYSPAGISRGGLKNAIKLAYNPSAADRDDLYTNRINPVTTLPGTGITLFGDKTALASTSAFDRINVRRLFLNIEKRVERLASGVLFEQNDVLTRSSFSSAVNSYLSEVQARRGITDFLVVCDETNNTPDVIDRNEFVAEILVKAARSINFVNITFTATKTGVTFAEVVGR